MPFQPTMRGRWNAGRHPAFVQGRHLDVAIGPWGAVPHAGAALFRDSRLWDLHGAVGGLLAVPVPIGMHGVTCVPCPRGFGRWGVVVGEDAQRHVRVRGLEGAQPVQRKVGSVHHATLCALSGFVVWPSATRRAGWTDGRPS
ncbi:DUF6220 domain-containing protein [Paracoccus yibinensis]|uniref:DUF6220 domain-containing protein n=1 Tax=Paracoccus yibinensis TaxID=3068891 RepID=UPI00358E680C